MNGVTKETLREKYLGLRKCYADQHGSWASKAITRAVRQLPAFRRAQTVMMYVPFRHEVDTWGLMRAVKSTGRTLVLPKTVPEDRRLILAGVTDPNEQLAVGNYGIMEPVLASVSTLNITEVDLVLVPGLVFDVRGYRVGYGGGYYDRLIAEASRQKTRFMGLAYDLQVTSLVPTSRYDQCLDGIVTERRVIFVGNS